MLAEIVKDSTHAAYVAFTKGYKSTFAYFMRTIDSFEDYVEPIDEVINDIFLPVLFCQTEPLPDELREPFPIAPAQGALGIPYMKAEISQQYAASPLHRIRQLDLLRSTVQARDNGASSWLNAEALEEQDLTLNKQQFRDLLHLHFNLAEPLHVWR